MISFDLNFFPRDDVDDYELDDRIEDFLSSLICNGNIIGEHVIEEHNDCCRVRVLCWSPDALDDANLTGWARRDLAKLNEFLKSAPQFERIVEVECEQMWCQCSNPTERLVFTTFLAKLSSPINCLDCGYGVPLYHLPLIKGAREQAIFLGWQNDYQALDILWMHSDVGERFAYRQLARPKSDFMKATRELAAKLEAATGIATYSFLLHYNKKWGNRCPLCARKWKWKNTPNTLFAFKCDHCHLITSEAS